MNWRLTQEQLKFLCDHWQKDMSPFQLAWYFGVPESVVHDARKNMGLKYVLGQLTAFKTPYPFEVAKNVKKFSWPEPSVDGDATSCRTD